MAAPLVIQLVAVILLGVATMIAALGLRSDLTGRGVFFMVAGLFAWSLAAFLMAGG